MEAEPESTGVYGSTGGRKLVPWSSWVEWCFVRDCIFSVRPDLNAALRRIAAWRSRGCLPNPVDVTAAFAEIRLQDPFFRSGMAGDDNLESDEMLAMLYSMAIIRFVNCFLDRHKKNGCSIFELAEAAGIPRLLVDIRHESSHRDIPSLRLLRLAATKAFDWLKSSYWDSQTKAIPDVRLELRSRLYAIAPFLKGEVPETGKSGSKRKRSEKATSHNIKYICRLYDKCPSEVVSVLLEFFQLDGLESFENSDVHQSDSFDVHHSSGVHNQISNSDMKTIVTEISKKNPRVLFGIIRSVVEMIETSEDLENQGELYACMSTGPSKMKNLCSLLLWTVTNIKELKDSGCIGLVHEIGVVSSDKNALPRLCLAKLMQKCLSLLIIRERCIADATLLLIEMAGSNNVKEKLRKLHVLSLQGSSKSIMPNKHESAENVTEHMEISQLRKRKNVCLSENGTDGSFDTSMTEKPNRWSITKSWTPCPLGMIPCSYSSAAVLPALDAIICNPKDDTLEHENLNHDNLIERFDSHSETKMQLDDESIPDIPALSPEREISGVPELTSPLKGRLLVGGLWKEVTEEELLFIKSKIKKISVILASLILFSVLNDLKL